MYHEFKTYIYDIPDFLSICNWPFQIFMKIYVNTKKIKIYKIHLYFQAKVEKSKKLQR